MWVVCTCGSILNWVLGPNFYRGQHQIEVSALDDKVKCLQLELEKTRKASHEISLQLETKVRMLLVILSSVFRLFEHLLEKSYLETSCVQGIRGEWYRGLRNSRGFKLLEVQESDAWATGSRYVIIYTHRRIKFHQWTSGISQQIGMRSTGFPRPLKVPEFDLLFSRTWKVSNLDSDPWKVLKSPWKWVQMNRSRTFLLFPVLKV